MQIFRFMHVRLHVSLTFFCVEAGVIKFVIVQWGSQNIAEVLSDINELPKWWPLTYQYRSHIPVILKVHPNYITGLDDVIK